MGRLVLTGILPAVLVILTIAGINGTRKYWMQLDVLRDGLAKQSETLALWYDAVNQRSSDAARELAVAQEAGYWERRDRTIGFMQHLLGRDPMLAAAWVVPAGPANDQASPAVMVVRTGPGPNDTATRSPDTKFASEQLAKVRRAWEESKRLDAQVSEPYNKDGSMYVEHVAPVVRDGKLIGFAGVDRSLAATRKETLARAAAYRVDIFVLSAGGRVVVATDGSGADYSKTADLDELGGQEIKATPYGKLFASLIDDPRSNFTIEAENPGTGETDYFAISHVSSGKRVVLMAVPKSQLTDTLIADNAFTLGVVIMGAIVMVTILWFPARQIVRRVDMAAQAAQQVASGDLTRQACGVECPDETGDLLRALDSMTTDLNTLVGQVSTASVQLTSTATELGATARQQEEVAASFGASSAQIAAAVRQINATGQELAREMVHVSESASATANLAQEGRTQLEGMEGAMKALDHATGGVAERLAAINEKAVNITSVVTTITKVAEQTNLLSVNAAIEAEKAGEYGRGFLVVAREIRRLADQTGQATLDIERMVKEMQGAVSSGVMEMDRFSDQVRRNVSDVRGIGRSMQEIIERVDEGTRSFGTVREGMQSQAAGAAQISDAMATLSGNAKATAEAVREFGRAAEDLQQAIGTLKTSIAAFHLRT